LHLANLEFPLHRIIDATTTGSEVVSKPCFPVLNPLSPLARTGDQDTQREPFFLIDPPDGVLFLKRQKKSTLEKRAVSETPLFPKLPLEKGPFLKRPFFPTTIQWTRRIVRFDPKMGKKRATLLRACMPINDLANSGEAL
jgi:hypothetical protein